MTTYRAGQRVRIEVEGTVRAVSYTNFELVPDGDGPAWNVTTDGAATVTVLSEPRPDEPTGLGAVVEAGYEDSAGVVSRQLWVSNRGKGELGNRWTSIPYWGFLDWSALIDPVVLSEGWTP